MKFLVVALCFSLSVWFLESHGSGLFLSAIELFSGNVHYFTIEILFLTGIAGRNGYNRTDSEDVVQRMRRVRGTTWELNHQC